MYRCIYALLVLSIVAGCAPSPTPTSDVGLSQPPQGKYLFVEVWVKVEGTGRLPGLAIDFPGYSFDGATGVLKPSGFAQGFSSLAPTDWGYVGEGSSRQPSAGTGIGSQLTVLNRFPHMTTVRIGTGKTSDNMEETRPTAVELLAVSADGKLTANIDGAKATLAPGESWSRVAEADLNAPPFNGRYKVTSTVTNYGWQDRAKLQAQSTSAPSPGPSPKPSAYP